MNNMPGTHVKILNYQVHVVHILTGVIIGVAIIIPFIFWYRRKYKKIVAQTVSVTQEGKQEVQSEKIKSEIVLAAIDDGVVVVDNGNVIQVYNGGAANITGWPAEEAVGLDYHSVFKLINARGEVYGETEDPFVKVRSQKTVIRDNTAVFVTKSGKQIPIHLSISPLLNDKKEVTGSVAVFRDVTQERQEEKQRGEFISTASHEMRTPVAAIEGYLALALNDKVANIDVKARGYLEKAHASTQSLGKLFQDLLTSAKAEDGRLVSHPQVLEMGEYLEQVTDTLRFTAEKKGLLMEFLVGSNPGGGEHKNLTEGHMVRPLYYTYADPERLKEVVVNLFDNAVKYTETGKISIGLTGNNNVIQFYIRDTGHGIPTEDIPHLFQKFYRVDSSVTRTIGGTGLGLFICRKIVELYNGRIWVKSELGKGSTFYINLPRLDAAKAVELQKNEASQTIMPSTPLTQASQP